MRGLVLRNTTLAELVAAVSPWTESSVKSALDWDVARIERACAALSSAAGSHSLERRLAVPRTVGTSGFSRQV
jgi:hypothetical protein